jgi:hypothetical protein
LEKQLITTEEKPGMLSKYAKTYVVDTLGQFAGQGNKMIADALESEWFQYVGSNLTTTREFCRHLTKKRYVHISEFPAILKGKIDGHKCKIYTATGLPYGMKEGTNADNFIENRGGWNCGHELIPVSDLTVPKEIREKMLSRVNESESEYKYEPVINIENIIRKNKDFETAVAFDKDGNIIIDKRGQATSVSFTNDEMSKMKNGILTHNHPRGWSSPENSLGRIGNSFSKDDISLAINTDLSEIRAVTPHYTFIMKRPANGWPDLQQSIKEWNQTERVMRNNFDNIISQSNNKKTDIDRINSIYYHKLCKEFSKKYGIEYIKKKTR